LLCDLMQSGKGHKLARNLHVVDLLAYGIGATVGAGT